MVPLLPYLGPTFTTAICCHGKGTKRITLVNGFHACYRLEAKVAGFTLPEDPVRGGVCLETLHAALEAVQDGASMPSKLKPCDSGSPSQLPLQRPARIIVCLSAASNITGLRHSEEVVAAMVHQ